LLDVGGVHWHARLDVLEAERAFRDLKTTLDLRLI
jgi:hypothetical protein